MARYAQDLRYRCETYTERALQSIEKDVWYLVTHNFGYGMARADVAQELRIQVWRKIHLYDPKKKSFRTWAQQVMRNRLIDMSRKKKEILDSEHREFIVDRDEEELLVFNEYSISWWEE